MAHLDHAGEELPVPPVLGDVELPGWAQDLLHVVRLQSQGEVGVAGRLAPQCGLAGRVGCRDVTQWGEVQVGGVALPAVNYQSGNVLLLVWTTSC